MGSASNVVEPEFIEMQKNLNQREPIGTDPMEENTWIWKPPMEGHRYLMSIDASRGDAADRTALEIIDMDGIDEKTGETIMEQVLEYHGKKPVMLSERWHICMEGNMAMLFVWSIV